MKRLLLIMFMLSSLTGKSQCNYELCITDDFGDGWNGNTVDVFVNGNFYGNYGASLVGTGPECFFIAVNNGDDVDVIFNATGAFVNECNFALTDASGNQAGAGDDISNINNVIGNCPCGATAVSATPELILNCSGMQDTINFVAGGICTGNYEYQVLVGGAVVQGWSTSSVFYSSPSANTSYTVQARCSACPTSVASDNFDVEIIDPPIISGVLEFCAPGSTSITASGSTGDFEWFTDEIGGTQLATTPTYTTPNLNDTTTYWLQANGLSTSAGKILITECGLEGFAGATSADYLEISNLYATPVNTTGWVAAISADYNNINNVNTILWDLPNTFNACSVESRNDISSDPNYWGNNIMWNPGANTTYKSWAIIIDNNGNVIDFVAWGWSAADIAGFNPTINGFNITLGPEWAGNGCDATCGVAGGAPLSIQRIGNQDGNTLTDFVCQASTPDVVNPGLFCGWTPVSCRTPVTVIVNPLPIIDMSEDTSICNGNSVELFADTNGLLVEQFTMTFDAAFSYSTLNTSLPGNYYAVVSGTFSGGGPCEERDGGFWFYQGCNNINPIPAYPWQWNGTNPNTQSQVPTVYNPNHIYNFYFNGGSSQAFSFQEQNASWYGDNSGSLTFQIYYLGNVLWSNGVTTSFNNVSPTQTTTYTVSVDYGSGCLATDSVIVSVSDPSYVENIVPSTCGNSNGEISLVASNGIAPYQFSIDNGVTFQSNGLFTGLMANSYDVLIVDDVGCQVAGSLTVSDINGLIAQIDAQNNVSCLGGSDGTVTVSASGSTPAYSYAIDGITFVASGTFSGLSVGPYTITAEDALGCQVTVPVTITEPTVLVGTLDATTDVLCAGGNNGSLTVSGSAATPNYQYSIDGGTTFQASGVFGTLTAGNYVVTIEDLNGCQTIVNGAVNEPLPLTGSVVTTTDATCGQANGSGEVVGVNGTAAYQYSIDGGATFQASGVFGTLTPGTYTITIEDLNNCQTAVPVTINDLAGLTAQIDAQTNVTCFGGSNGSVTVTASGSTAPYQYSIDGGATFISLGSYSGLAPGPYTIVCEDFNGCLFPVSFTILEPTALVGTLVGTNSVTCFGGSDGSLSVNGSGATPTYQFSIDGGATFQPTGTFSNIAAGNYVITLEDINLCQSTVNASLNEPTQLVGNLDATIDVSCFGGSDGSLTVSASGASPSYQFSIDGGVTFQTLGTFDNLAQGTYVITVQDANNCEATINATINEPTIIVANYVSATDATCGNPNGTFEVSGSGGTPPFDYSMDGGITYQTSGIFSGLLSGNYTVTVSDANSCVETIIVTINNLSSPTIDQVTEINATCNGTCDGQVAVNATGATQYSIDNGNTFQASNIFNNVCAGTHVVVVTNAVGCLEYSTAIVTEPLPLVVNVSTTNLLCYNVCVGEIDITATGGTAAIQYSIDNGTSFALNGSFTGVCAGTYDIVINDGGTCTHSTQVMIFEPALLATAVDVIDATCAGTCDGSINAVPFGGTGAYTYTWSPAQTGNNPLAQNLCVGPFSLTIEDANGCSINTTASIGSPPGIVITSVDATDVLCNGDCNGSITINATDASEYSLDGNTYTPSNVFTGLCAGGYTVYAQNSNGCFESEQVILGSPAPVSVIVESDTTICIDGTASPYVTASGGVGSFTYLWDNNMATQGINVSPLTSQTYCVRATDGNGCASNLSCVTVTVNQALNATALSDQAICPEDMAQISAAGTGGNGGPYNYVWDQGVGAGSNQIVSPAGTTIYTVSVTDGCETPAATASVTITIYPTPVIGFSGDVLSGCVPLDVSFEEINVPAGSQCFWEFGDGGTGSDCSDMSYLFTEAGCWSISLAITTPEGCAVSHDAASYICVYDYPSASFMFGPQPATITNPTITFVNTSSGASTYDWTFDVLGFADNDNAENPVYTFLSEPGTYEVCLNATSNEGCATDTCANVVINDELLLYVPNSFTPNGDGINDVFLPIVNGVDPLKYELLIFNRWGELIFEDQYSSEGWDGHYKGVPAQEGAYVWKINCKDASSTKRYEYIGHVTLLK
jgi:large repetitive protein